MCSSIESGDFDVTMVTFDILVNPMTTISSTEVINLVDNEDFHGNITFTVEIVPASTFFTLGGQSSSTVVFEDNDEGGMWTLGMDQF